MNKYIDFKEIAQVALNSAEILLNQWLPDGKRHGHEYQARNPTRADNQIGSFSINLNTGAWADFATDDKGADLISLYAYLHGVKQGEAAKEIAKQLRMDTLPPAAPKKSLPKMTDDGWETIAPVSSNQLHGLHALHGWKETNGKTRLMESIYRDENGEVLGMVVRFPKSDGGKEDLPRTFGLDKKSGLMEWRWRTWDGMRFIYGLDVLAQKPEAPVLIVEGEKCKNITEESGWFKDFAVISWQGGCNAWHKTDWSRVQNRRVVLFPDADAHREKLSNKEKEAGVKETDKPLLPLHEQGGMKAMLGIEKELLKYGNQTAIVAIPEPDVWTAGYDIADMITDLEPLANARELVDEALTRVSPELTLQGVSHSVKNAPNVQTGGVGDDDSVYNSYFAELLEHFALVEGKKSAVDKRNGTTYSYSALKVRFNKDVVDSWFNMPDKPLMTQYEIKRLKDIEELKQRSNDTEILEMMERYIYLDGSTSVWDKQLWRMIEQGAAKLAMGDSFKIWVNSPNRKVIPIDNIVFNPMTLDLGDDYINLFRGLPVTASYPIPREEMPQNWGEVISLFPECMNIFRLIKHLCNNDWLITQFVMNWLAYPLQHLGAKLACSLVFHGDVQGAGKSWLFDDIMGQIYGEHGGHYGQEDLETIYTANRSAKLYGAFEEVFNNQQKYSNSGKIKNMVTRKTHRIERKFVDAMDEANHINCVFTSNEAQPYKLDENDRRACVVSPQKRLPDDLKQALEEEIANGGVQAFYSLLMSLPLMLDYEYVLDEETGLYNKVVHREKPIRFHANTEAIMTEAKKLVISFGRFTWQTFFYQLQNGEIDGVVFGCCRSEDIYQLYLWWCKKNHEKEHYSRSKFLNNIKIKMYYEKRWTRCPTSNRPQERKQVWILIPKDLHIPEGCAEMDVMGTQVLSFETAVRQLVNRFDD